MNEQEQLRTKKICMNVQEQLRRLLDFDAIRDLPRRYAHCIWSKDAAAAAQLFVEDGCMDTGKGSPIRGRAALAAAYSQAFESSTSQPFVHNHVIDLSGDTATGVCYLDLRVVVGDKILMGSAHYHDVYIRQGAEWLFQSRKLFTHYQVPIAASPVPTK